MDHPNRRRWFQVSLKSLFVLMLVVAAFFGGYGVAERRAQKAIREAQEAAEQARRPAEQNFDLSDSSFSFALNNAR